MNEAVQAPKEMAGTLLQHFEDPPTATLSLKEEGSTHIDPMHYTLAENCFPRHIVGDTGFIDKTLQSVRRWLSKSSAPASFESFRQKTERLIHHAPVGNETDNWALFIHLFDYIKEFLGEAKPSQSFQLLNHGPSTYKLCHNGTDQMIIKRRSVGAYNHYINDIQGLATGQGSEIIATSYETGARAIIFDLGSQMIQTGIRWGLLLGGTNFTVFALKRAHLRGETYHHIIASKSYPCLPERPDQGHPSPGLISILTAILYLRPSEPGSFPNLPPTYIITPYTMGRSARGARNTIHAKASSQNKKGAPKIIGEMPANVAATEPTKELRNRTIPITAPTPKVQRSQYITTSDPYSPFIYYQSLYMRISAQEAWDILMNPNDNDLPYRGMDNDFTIRIEPTGITIGSVLVFEGLGSGSSAEVAGVVYIHPDGSEENMAMKHVTESFTSFYREIAVYEHLAGKSFALKFYGGFAASLEDDNEPHLVGEILLEELEKTFETFDGMSQDEKNQAVACLDQLHDVGYTHGDIRAENFGIANGRVVIFDFGNSQPCDDPEVLKRELDYMKTFPAFPEMMVADVLGIEPRDEWCH